MKIICTLVVMLLLCVSAIAQSPPEKAKYTFTDGLLTAGWAASIGAERWSTEVALSRPKVREGGLIQNANARLGINIGLLGLTEFLQHRVYTEPKHQKTFRVLKLAMIGLNGFLIIHNSRTGK